MAKQSQDRFLPLLRDALKRCGIAQGGRLLVAISGGADSTALLLGLHNLAAEIGLQLEAAHFNHALRGNESTADEEFCRSLCESRGIWLHVDGSDVRAYASGSGTSIEATARKLRYDFMAQVVAERNLDAVVTAHTMNDQAETVLLAITRGAGLRGVAGMAYVTERRDLPDHGKPLRVIRPMLMHHRQDNEAYCELNGVVPRVDASNADVAYARNRIRHNVLPELAKVNAGVVDALARLAGVAAADVGLVGSMARRAFAEATLEDGARLSRPVLVAMEPALLTHVLRMAHEHAVGTAVDLDMTAFVSAVDAVRSVSTGSIDLPNGVTLLVDHDTVQFNAPGDEQPCPFPLRTGEHELISAGQETGRVVFDDSKEVTVRKVSPVPDVRSLTRWQAVVAASVSSGSLTVRSRRDGDRFQPLGMDKPMKLQDFFVNQHVPARWRDRVPLVIGEDGICWVVGERIAEWARVPEDAEDALMFEYTSPGKDES